MRLPRVDPLIFEALQANAGADFVRQLVEAFAEEAPRLLIALGQAADSADAVAFETAIHTLKSNGVAFGASRFAEMARRIEWQRLSTPGAEVEALAAELSACVGALRTMASQ